MKVFVTGATGFIGSKLVSRLVEYGYQVHALYRTREKAGQIEHENVTLFKGDITNKESLDKAIQGCDFVFHTAAFAKVWSKDPSIIYSLNVDATISLLDLALKYDIKKVVITSTAGVFGPSVHGITNEGTSYAKGYFTHYEKSKSLMEEKIIERAKNGQNIVIVNPTRVYGPGILNESNSVTIMIKKYLEGKWRIIPGNGKSIGNYVFIEDVVNGHLLALENGEAGEKYILGGSNASYNEFFRLLREKSGKNYLMLKFPVVIMLLVANIMMLLAKVFGISPMITPGLVRKFNHNWIVSDEKAKIHLHYSSVTIEEGIEKTMNWLNKN